MATETADGPPRPAFTAPSVADLAPRFPQLEILELIGQGGMAVVYKARQPALDRFVALKILPAGSAPEASFAERFNREARALARLSHPNIVAVYDFGRVEGVAPGSPAGPSLPLLGAAPPSGPRAVIESGPLYYFLMEFVDGVNLRQLERSERLSPREALGIVPQICDALQYAHDQGIVHRDIKPENVLVDRRGRVKIADFGLAKLLDAPPDSRRLTVEGQVMGTPHYMAPEQVERPSEVDHRADIFSLGVVFYELLTGELPLGRFAPPSRKVRVDVRLDEVVLRALEKEPERRYQRAGEVKTAVETIVEGPPAAVEVPQGPRAGEPRLAGQSGASPPAVAPGDRTSAGGADSGSASTDAAAVRGRSPGAEPAWPGRPGLGRPVVVGLVVACAIFAGALFITRSLPDTYAAKAVLVVTKTATNPDSGRPFDPYFIQTEIERLRSHLVLTNALERFGPAKRWGRTGTPLLPDQALALMRERLVVRQARNTALIEVQFYSEDRHEAAEVANAIADSYLATRPSDRGAQVTLLDRAALPLRPVRPNRPLNLAIGGLLGLGLGCGAGVCAWGWGWLRRRTPPRSSPRPATERTYVARQRVGYGPLALGLFLTGTLGTLVLMTVSPRHDLALLFGGLALVLALVFGVVAWRERFGRASAVATLLVFLGCGTVVVLLVGGFTLSRARQAALAAQRAATIAELRVRQEALDRAAERQTEPLAGPAQWLAQLASDQMQVRRDAALAIAALESPPAALVPSLLRLLKEDGDGILRICAAVALGRLGTNAGPEVVKGLEAALEDHDPRVRADSAEALARVEPLHPSNVVYYANLLTNAPARDFATASMQDQRPREAVVALGRMGTSAAPAWSAVERWLANDSLRPEVEAALRAIDPNRWTTSRVVVVEDSGPAGTVFGPTIERVVPDFESLEPPQVLHLLTGELKPIPAESRDSASQAAARRWAATNRVLAFTNRGGDTRALSCSGWRFGDLPTPAWEELTPDRLGPALSTGTTVLSASRTEADWSEFEIPLSARLPLTFAFRTSEGDYGVIEILDITRQPRRIHLRYRLVQPPPTP